MLEEGVIIGDNHGKQWQITRKIGSGKCCEVYEGLDVASQSCQVAVKVYNEGLKFNCAHQRELALLNIIRETCGIIPQLVDVIDSCCYGNQQVLIEEYLQPSLPAIIYTAKEQGHLSLFLIHKILLDVTRAFSSLHFCGFVHADLKPDNIMWSSTLATFKLIDFGLSFNIQDQEIGLVQSSNYRAPEVSCRQDQSSNVPNTAIDIWSLGVLVLYFITEEKFAEFQKPLGSCSSCQNEGMKCENLAVIDRLFKQTTWHEDCPRLQTFKQIAFRCLQCKFDRRPSSIDILQQLSASPITNASFLDLLILPTNIIRLLNMVNKDEVTDETEIKDIKEDIVEECRKFGQVTDCILPTDGHGLGQVFVCFSKSSEATSAFTELNGRSFNGRTVITTYFLPDDIYHKNLF